LPHMIDFNRIELMSFDCYGTLIDWERGIIAALRSILQAHGKSLDDRAILKLFGEIEHPEQEGAFKTYRQVLQNVVRRFSERLGFTASDADIRALPDSLANWRPFPDTVQALTRLGARYRLMIISNTDDDLFAATARHLNVRFADVITAQQAGAYKPSHKIFELAFDRVGTPPERWLHAGQSAYHDVIPAKELGLVTALVYRRGAGAVPDVAATPDLQVPDLETLAALAAPA
jgi:2-haloacid dehalogenase